MMAMTNKLRIKHFVLEHIPERGWLEVVAWLEEDCPGISKILIKGWGNGYAIIPPGHPLYGAESLDIEVHGPITLYAWARDFNIPEISEEDKDGFVIGFNCQHYCDTPESCPKEYVEERAKELAEILDAMW